MSSVLSSELGVLSRSFVGFLGSRETGELVILQPRESTTKRNKENETLLNKS